MYYQQPIDWESLKASVDEMFAPAPTPTVETPVFCEKHVDYTGEVADWLREMPTPVADTQAVRFSRVSRTLTFQGTHIDICGDFEIPDGSDPDVYVQAFVDECGLCAESYNAANQIIRKYTTRNTALNFI